MSLPFLPPSLADLLAFVPKTEAFCIGAAYPSPHKCLQKLSTSDEHFAIVYKCLQDILTSGIDAQGPGLISKLRTIASAFLCHERHCQANIELFPQYWLALHTLRSVLRYTGLAKLPPSGSADESQARSAIDDLNPTEVYWADLALKKLHDSWWQNDEDGSRVKFRDMLKEKFLQDEVVKSKHDERESARHRWISWGFPAETVAIQSDDGSNNNTPSCSRKSMTPTPSCTKSPREPKALKSAPTTPTRPPIPQPASAPQPSIPFSLGGSPYPQHVTSPCIPQPRRSPRSRTVRTKASTADASSNNDQNCDHDGPSNASISKEEGSQEHSHSISENAGQSAPLSEEQPALDYFSNPANSSLDVPQPRRRHRRQSSADSGASHKSKLDTNQISEPQGATSVSKVTDDLSYLDNMGCEGALVPSFKHCPDEPKDVRQTVFAVFAEMKKDLADKTEDAGCIYALSIPGYDGFIKIGRTRQAIDKRIADHKRCFGIRLNLLDYNDYCTVSHHKRVERLAHLELRQYRRTFECKCKSKHKDHCDGADGLVEHGEWFEIDERKAMQVVHRWRNWMSANPYCNRKLRQAEHLRISQYTKVKNQVGDEGRRNGHRLPLNGLISEDKRGNQIWRWDKFMRFSRWQLFHLQARIFLFEERYERADISSRWDSLWTHWKSNALFYVMIFMLSSLLVPSADLFPRLITLTPVIALANMTVLGSIAILYAA